MSLSVIDLSCYYMNGYFSIHTIGMGGYIYVYVNYLFMEIGQQNDPAIFREYNWLKGSDISHVLVLTG